MIIGFSFVFFLIDFSYGLVMYTQQVTHQIFAFVVLVLVFSAWLSKWLAGKNVSKWTLSSGL